MKLKYQLSDGEVICAGAMNLIPDVTYGVLDIDTIPEDLRKVRVVNAQIVPKTKEEIEQIDAMDKYNIEALVNDIYTAFLNDLFRLEPRFATVKEFLAVKNFSGLKLYLGACVQNSLITVADYQVFNSILLKYGVNLEEF